MLRKGALAAGLMGTVCLAGTASADFTGWFFDSYAVTVGGAQYAVIDVYGQFNGTTDTVLSVFNSNITNSGGVAFKHNDSSTLGGQPGSWAVTACLDIPMIGVVPTNDSFVTIGGTPGATNTTSLDPTFTPSNAAVPPANSGWFNSSPPNLQGRVNAATQRTWVGRFVKTGISTAATLNFSANLGYNQGAGTPSQFAFNNGQGSGPTFTVSYVPAPGAIALLGLAGLAGRRRRN